MPSVNVPGVGVVNFPDTMSQQDIVAAIERDILPQVQEKPKPKTGFFANIGAGFESAKGDIGSIGAALGVSGAEEYSRKQQQLANEKATIPEFSDISSVKDAYNYASGLAGRSLPYMVAPIAAAVSAPAGIAAAAAGTAAGAIQFFGTDLTRQLQEGKTAETLDIGSAAAAAPFQAALDTVGFRYIPGLRKIFGQAGVKMSDDALRDVMKTRMTENLAGKVINYGTKAVQTAGVEGFTEAGQQVLERAQAGLSITDPEARKEYFDSFIGGAVLGGGLSLPGQAIERSSQQTQYQQLLRKDATDAAAAAEKQKADDAVAVEAANPMGFKPTPVLPDTYAEAVQEVERLKQETQTAEIKARITELEAYKQRLLTEDIEGMRRKPYDEPKSLEDQIKNQSALQGEFRETADLPTREVTAAEEAPVVEKEAPTVLDATTLDATGLPKQSGIYKQLLGKDLTDLEGLDAVMQTVERAKANKNLAPETKQALDSIATNAFNIYGKQAEMFGPRGGVLEPIKPEKVTAVQQKIDEVIKGKDLTDPAQVEEIRAALTDYANAPTRSAEAIAELTKFLDTLPSSAPEATDVLKPTETIDTTGQPSTAMAGKRRRATTQGTTTPDVTGVDDTGAAIGQPDAGTPVQPTALATPPAAPRAATPFTFRQPTAREKSSNNADAVLDLEGGNRVVFADGISDVFLVDSAGKELAAVGRFGVDSRKGVIKQPSDFPAFVPESLRQPIIDYQVASQNNRVSSSEENKLALANGRAIVMAEVKKLGAAAAPAKVEPAPVQKPSKAPTELQQRKSFGKALGATGDNPLRGRVNLSAQAAAIKENFKGVISALEKSKNLTVAEVARRAKNLKTKIKIDELASEEYEGPSFFEQQMSIDGAKMHLEALGKIRELAPTVDQLPDGARLPYDVPNTKVKAISEGKEASRYLTLADFVKNNNSMFGGLGLPEGATLTTKEDFQALNNAFENLTQTLGEDKLRLTSTASARYTGVSGAYNTDTDTILVPEYYAKKEAVLAHEIVHAQVANIVANPTKEQRPIVQRLTKLHAHVKNVLEERAKTDEYFRKPYGIVSEQEFIAESLSNPEFQYELSRIPYENTTAWSKFVETIAKLLGIKNDNAFTEILTIYDTLTKEPETTTSSAEEALPSGKINSNDAITQLMANGLTRSEATKYVRDVEENGAIDPEDIDRVLGVKTPASGKKTILYNVREEDLTPAGKEAAALNDRMKGAGNPKPADPDSILKKTIGIVQPREGEPSLGTRFRREFVDARATAVEKMEAKFNNTLTDSLGEIRGDLAQIQAQDHAAFAEGTMEHGGIQISKDNLVEIVDRDATMGKVFDIMTQLGNRLGSLKTAMQLGHNAFIAQRAKELNAHNAKIAQDVAAAEAKGNKKAAAKLRDQLITHYVTDEEIAAADEAMQKFPELKEAFKTFTEYKNGLIDFLVQTGRISEGKANEWKEAAGYVPWTRVEEEVNIFDESPASFKGGIASISKLRILDRNGSQKEIANVFDNMIGLTSWAVKTGMNAYASRRMAESLPDAFELKTQDAVDYAQKFNKERLIFTYKDGERTAYLLGSALDKSAFASNIVTLGPILKAFSFAQSTLRSFVTHMPAFAISQLIQDGTYRAMLLSGVKHPFSLPAKVAKNFIQAMAGEGIPAELARVGVSGVYDGMPQHAIDRARVKYGLEERNGFKKAWDKLEKFSLAADLAVRAAIYEQTINETKSPEMPEGDRKLALYRAKEYINFKHGGNSTVIGTLRHMVPFLNAYIQGMDILVRTMQGKGISMVEKREAQKLFLATGLKIAAMSAVYAMLAGDDDDYKGMEDYERDKNYIIPGTGLKIPVAPEVGFMFKVIPERIVRYVVSQGTDRPQDETAFYKGFKDAFIAAYSGTNLTPQLIKPALEVGVNYSFFTGNPIVGAGMKNLDPSMQFTEGTSELAKLFGTVGISPMKADYLIRGYTGMLGAFVLDATDAVANPDRMGKPVSKLPQLSTFMYDTTGRGYKSEFYAFRESVDQVVDTVNMFKREGRLDELREYLTEEKMKMYAMKGVVNKIETQLAALRKYRSIIANDPQMPADLKREKTDEILKQEKELLLARNVPKLRGMAGM